MAVALFGINEDDCIDLIEKWKVEKMKLTQTFDDLHARFEEVIERESQEIEDWIYSSTIGRFMAEAEDDAETIATVRLPGAYAQLPIAYMLAYQEHRDEDDLLAPLYHPTSPVHEHLNTALMSTRNQIVARCENVQHAAMQCERAGNRLNAAVSLIASLEQALA